MESGNHSTPMISDNTRLGGCLQNMNFQMFMDRLHFPDNSVFTWTTSNLNPFAVQPHFIDAELRTQNVSLPTLQCVPFSPYTSIYRNVGIRQPVSSTVSITGKNSSRTT